MSHITGGCQHARALEDAILKMDLKAPQDGIVVYRSNWRDEKKKVGDSVWFGEVVLSLPDLAEMKGTPSWTRPTAARCGRDSP